MTERPTSLTETPTDAQLQEFYGDAAAMLSAQHNLSGAMADLTEAPFSAEAQRTLANYLVSAELENATAAAKRIEGRG